MAEKKSICVDKMFNGWVVWFCEPDNKEDITNPKLCYTSEELFSSIKEFFQVEKLKHVNEYVSQIYLYEEGFLVQEDNRPRVSFLKKLFTVNEKNCRPSIFKEL